MSFLRTGAIAVLVAVISMVGPAVPRAQSSISILEVRAQAFIAAFNSGDPETYEAFRKKHRVPENPPDKDWREEYLGLYERWGKLELHDIMIEDEFTIVVRAAAERSPGSVRLTFALETAEPHRIESLTLALESSDDGPPEIDLPDLEIDSSMDAKTLTKKLDGYLEKLAKDDIYSGVTLIVRDGKELYYNGHGLASKSFRVPNTKSTRFRVGSITKSFTKVAIGQLVQDGKIKPDDTISDHLPDYANEHVAGKITVDQLVNHSSGLGGMNFMEFRQKSPTQFREPRDYIPLFADRPLLFEPGTQKQYSNAGYIVLGAIIASASEMRYADYITRNIFEPAGMKRSAFLSLDRPHEDIAVGYWKCDPQSDEWCNNSYIIEIDGGPSGGSYSTADDLYVFDRALRENRLLPPEYTHWFFSGDWPGDAVEVSGQWPAVGFAGGAEGVSTVYFSNGGWFIAVLCNYDEPIAEEIGMRIYRALVPAE